MFIGISLVTGRDVGSGKAVYIWISPNPVKMGPTLGGGGGVMVKVVQSIGNDLLAFCFRGLRFKTC